MVKPGGLSKRSKKPSPRKKRSPRPTPPSRPSEPAEDLDRDGTEKRILVAARKEFVAKGLDGARMQAIATSAGVNKALLHYYFRGKDRLYRTVLADTMRTVWNAL
ncbi:MAG TPA: helix-turn-helix domain-containing protein, partial [Fibrobacteria bacterium]|nr:helix-turn-helix domain-containing protein [Fibrobacteria bacterium]